ncbi:MAG TPA: 16S rRNA (cytidine(1402)-2'-O)-methyltransferase [Thermomicrobiales bacterium]|nr:16S rRNA (cytidine(1402)-2'-O)-methyltransferase [Thermomicrobiales bacterium]
MGTLYVVATPVGNLDDISPRAVRTLAEVSLIAAEDTRHTARLLRRYEIATPVFSYHRHNERERVQRLLEALVAGDVALVSDAGTPAVSDPGAVLVCAVRKAGHRVVPIPGPSSLVAAVSASGLVEGAFLFGGFLPRSGDERRRAMQRAAIVDVPLVLFESPNRLIQTLDDLRTTFGDVQAVVARELTKIHEEIRAGRLSELAEHYRSAEVRGEICIVVEAAPAVEAAGGTDDTAEIAARLLADGTQPSKAARALARITGMSSGDAYEVIRSVREQSDR